MEEVREVAGKEFGLFSKTLPGGAWLEIFTLDGQEYVKGEPADIVAVTKSGKRVAMRLREKVTSANALCSLHKKYRAMRKPRTNCEQCWEAYEQKNEVPTGSRKARKSDGAGMQENAEGDRGVS